MPTITELEVHINSQKNALAKLQQLPPELIDVLGPSFSQKKLELEAAIARLETDLKALEDETADTNTLLDCNKDQPAQTQEQETAEHTVSKEEKKKRKKKEGTFGDLSKKPRGIPIQCYRKQPDEVKRFFHLYSGTLCNMHNAVWKQLKNERKVPNKKRKAQFLAFVETQFHNLASSKDEYKLFGPVIGVVARTAARVLYKNRKYKILVKLNGGPLGKAEKKHAPDGRFAESAKSKELDQKFKEYFRTDDEDISDNE
jgi:hypothetical protein